MNTNTAIATTGNNNVPAEYKTKGSEQLMNRKGAVCGTRTFFGTQSASEIKDMLRAQGVKGAELTRRVNEALTNEGAQRTILATAWVQARAQEGYLADLGNARFNKSGGGSAELRMVKPKPAKATEAAVSREAAMKALGLTEADIEAIKLLNK